MTKDWTGNSNSIYKTLGASNHTDKERQNEDYYATDPKAADLLLELEKFSPQYNRLKFPFLNFSSKITDCCDPISILLNG